MRIARVALPVAIHSSFDYWVPEGLAIRRGSVVRAGLAKRLLIGVVVDMATTTDVAQDRVQPIHEIVDVIPPLPDDLLSLADFVAGYYQEPLGLVLSQIVPPIGRGGIARADGVLAAPAPPANVASSAATLNTAQQRAVAAVPGAP